MVVVNGRFTRQPLTGVQRYAHEIVRRLGSRVKVITPPRPARGAAGHLWEQCVLPSQVGGALLWSPANTGPLRVRNQVVTLHDLAVLDHPEWFRPAFARWYAWLLPRLARRVKRIITVSQFCAARLVDRLGVPEEAIVVIPNGVDARFRPQPRETVQSVRRALGLPERYVLYVGSLEPRKNLPVLLEAWRQVHAQLDDLWLVIAGGTYRSFREPGLRELPPRTRLIGHVGDENLPGLYCGALCFVYPSLYEGFGLPVLEAMACGVPVIASDIPALREVTGNAGFLVPTDDVDAWARELTTVATSPFLRQQHVQRGLARAQAFSWERAAAAIWELLENEAHGQVSRGAVTPKAGDAERVAALCK